MQVNATGDSAAHQVNRFDDTAYFCSFFVRILWTNKTTFQ